MPELRKDPVTNSWIIISTERSKRPMRGIPEEDVKEPDQCPFCPGNEKLTPAEIISYRQPESPDNWWVRGFSALSPILRIEGKVEQGGFGVYDTVSGIGAHEIIVETPIHGQDFDKMDTNQIEKIFWAYRDRINDLKKDKRFRYIMLFKNHGLKAGSSGMGHSHSQVIALPVTPKKIKEELEGAKFHYSLKERCIFCDIINQELQLDERVILKTKRFVVLAPWAPRFPYETWILPLKHFHDYTFISKEEMMELAYIIKRYFKALKSVLSENISYNLILHDTPNNIPHEGYWKTIEMDFHWHFEIIPRIANTAGFEWGTGFYINHVPPELSTLDLRKSI